MSEPEARVERGEAKDGTRGFAVQFVYLLWSAKWVIVFLLVGVVAGAGVFWCEGLTVAACNNVVHSPWLSLYTAFITALTIGYGDLAPRGVLGRLSAVLLGIVGMILVGVIVAASVKALERSQKP